MRCVLLATLSSRGCEQGAAALHALPAARSSRGREQAAAARRALSAARSSRGYEQRCSSATCAVSNPPAADDGSNQPADAAQLPDAPLHSTRRRTETCARRYATEQDTPRAPSSLALQCMLLGSRGVTAHRASAAKLQQLTAARVGHLLGEVARGGAPELCFLQISTHAPMAKPKPLPTRPAKPTRNLRQSGLVVHRRGGRRGRGDGAGLAGDAAGMSRVQPTRAQRRGCWKQHGTTRTSGNERWDGSDARR
eukprot:352277-Chlamydomonas_euryale.AAC.2